jgi:hypothetical protein
MTPKMKKTLRLFQKDNKKSRKSATVTFNGNEIIYAHNRSPIYRNRPVAEGVAGRRKHLEFPAGADLGEKVKTSAPNNPAPKLRLSFVGLRQTC